MLESVGKVMRVNPHSTKSTLSGLKIFVTFIPRVHVVISDVMKISVLGLVDVIKSEVGVPDVESESTLGGHSTLFGGRDLDLELSRFLGLRCPAHVVQQAFLTGHNLFVGEWLNVVDRGVPRHGCLQL